MISRVLLLAGAACVNFALAPFLQSAETVSAQVPPAPPAQCREGPGGCDYTHGSWKQSVYGRGGTSYWLFEPADPVPKSAPLVIFLHGWAAIDPWFYGAWVEHLVRRGNIVLYPRYQTSLFTGLKSFLPNTLEGIHAGLKELQTEGHVKVQPEQVSFLGHSMGAILAANVASVAAGEGLPQPKAIMCVQPGRTPRRPDEYGLELLDLRSIPRETLLLCLAGDNDSVVGDRDAVNIFTAAQHIPAANRNLVYFMTDTHGQPPLRGNHYGPCSLPIEFWQAPGDPPVGIFPTKAQALLGIIFGNIAPLRYLLQTPHGQSWLNSPKNCPVYAETFFPPDSTDFDHWRLFDALCDAAYTGKNRALALGDTSQQKNRGKWSDGTPVRELKVIVPYPKK